MTKSEWRRRGVSKLSFVIEAFEKPLHVSLNKTRRSRCGRGPIIFARISSVEVGFASAGAGNPPAHADIATIVGVGLKVKLRQKLHAIAESAKSCALRVSPR